MIQILRGEKQIRPDGSSAVWVHLITSSEPASLAIDGEDIGLGEGTVLAAGSTIIWPGGSAVLYEDDGTFIEAGAGSAASGSDDSGSAEA